MTKINPTKVVLVFHCENDRAEQASLTTDQCELFDKPQKTTLQWIIDNQTLPCCDCGDALIFDKAYIK